MWSAIKSDLFDFVDTIKNDTTKTISKVIGDPNDDDDLEVSIRQKALVDLRRSFNTYSSPIIDQQNMKDYEKFLKTFSLSSHAAEISSILDEEQDVARYYTELVPIQIRPEEFWARYFYKNLLLTRNGVVNLDDDDDDDECWESTEKADEKNDDNDNSNNIGNNIIDGRTIHDIYDENVNLKKHITTLTLHIADLEKMLETEKLNYKKLLESSSKPIIATAEVAVETKSTTGITGIIETATATSTIGDDGISSVSGIVEKAQSSLSLAETLSDKSESSSCVIVETSEVVAPKVLTPENKAKILASLDNDDDDDDEWS